MKETPLILKALAFAENAHAGQCRKGSDIPYIVHPIEAGEIVSQITDDDELICAALLHDTIEDTDTTMADLEVAFGKRIAKLVGAESENKREEQRPEDSWKLRKTETIKHLENAEDDVKLLTLADKLSNIRSMKRDYDILGHQLWERFNQKNPQEQYWYYQSVLEALEDLKEVSAWQELKRLIGEVFIDGEHCHLIGEEKRKSI